MTEQEAWILLGEKAVEEQRYLCGLIKQEPIFREHYDALYTKIKEALILVGKMRGNIGPEFFLFLIADWGDDKEALDRVQLGRQRFCEAMAEGEEITEDLLKKIGAYVEKNI
jgi:hypothetical protein